MKKSKIKFVIKKAVQKHYTNGGFTNTAIQLLSDIDKEIDYLFKRK